MRTRNLKFLCIPLLFSMGIKAQALETTASLLLKEKTPIRQLAENVLNPSSERFGKYYSPEEIRDLVAPSDAEYSKLIKRLTSMGFSISYESPTHLFVTIKGEEGLFKKVFKDTIPGDLSLISYVCQSTYVKTRIVADPDTSPEQPGITPDEIKKAYGFDALYNVGLTGKDQYIAIATYMNFEVDNVKQYYEKIKLSPKPQIETVSFNGEALYDDGSALSTELAAELIGTVAPGAHLLVFTSTINDESAELAMFTAILDDNRAKIVNYNWGRCETYVSSLHRPNMDKVFARAVAQGVNIFNTSGDNGTDGCLDGSVTTNWPAEHPYVIAVGGTSLHLDKMGSDRETAFRKSGAGVSNFYALPEWQSDFKAPFVKRSIPDVAFFADPDPGLGIWVRPGRRELPPGWAKVGGTEIAVSHWAGFLALVNEGRSKIGKQAIGYINPILYKASEDVKSKIFTDIVSGTNGTYSAGPGWDAVTGWGSMKVPQMFEFLVAQ